ncbi:zinc finger BED domain-containing protein 4-like, partial [Halictus rubicundus]
MCESRASEDMEVVVAGCSDMNDSEAVETYRSSRSKSDVWQHFLKIGRGEAQCNICDKKFKLKYGNTSSLLRHLKAVHGSVIHLPTTTQIETESVKDKNIAYFDKNSSRSKQLTEGIAQIIALDLQPYSIVDDIGFRSFINIVEPRYEIPSRTTFSRRIIPKMYEDLQSKIKNEIST